MPYRGSLASVVGLLLSAFLLLALSVPTAQSEADNDNAAGSGGAPKPSGQPNDRPDLKIEYTGYQNPSNTQLVTFKVTNVGKARSSAIKAQVTTLEPDPTPWLREIDVPALAPGASHVIFYPLAAPCNGHKVRATVDDQLDLSNVNDRVEAQVCPAVVAPKDPRLDSSRIVDSGISAIPEHLRKGEHYLDVPPSVFRRHVLSRLHKGIFGCYGNELKPSFSDVGFDHIDGFGCDRNTVSQLIVDFDLQWLKDIEKKLVFRAELRYDEPDRFGRRTNEDAVLDFEFYDPPTCVGRLGLAPLGYGAAINRQELLSTAEAGDARLNGGWLVTRDIQFSIVPGSRFQGFVLHPLNEDLDAEDWDGCESKIENLRLWLHYAIL